MQEINVKILKQRVVSSNIVISQNVHKKFEIHMESRAKMKTPIDEDNRSVLLNLELDIGTREDEIKIELVSDFILELDAFPEDCDQIAEQKLVPMARNALLNTLDELLVIMGYSKMELAKK